MGIYDITETIDAVVRYEENDQKSTAIATGSSQDRNGSRWVWAMNYRPIPSVVYRVQYIVHNEEGADIDNDSFGASMSVMF